MGYKPKTKWKRNRKPSVNTPQYLATLEGLSVPQLKQKLLARMESSEAARKRFWKKSKMGNSEECWNWKASVSCRYGVYTAVIGKNRFNFRAHRIAYYFEHRFLPDNHLVCHHCDNPVCVNPKHLFVGTNQDNMDDMKGKKRQALGIRNASHKLTDGEVRELRFLRFEKKHTYDSLSKRFNLAPSTIRNAICSITWKHISMKNHNPLEKDIEHAVCSYSKSLGVIQYKFTSLGRRSVPDRLFILPGGAVFFMELKRKGQVPTPAQRAEITKLQQQGAMVYVIDNIEDGKRAIDCELMKGY